MENRGFCLLFFFLNDEIGFRVSRYTSCSGISGIIVPLSEGKNWHFFLSRLETLVKMFPRSEQREN